MKTKKLSQLIKELEALIEEKGDLDVFARTDEGEDVEITFNIWDNEELSMYY